MENLKHLETLVMDFYARNPTSCKFKHMSKLSTFIRKKGGPKLRGKAIEIRSFGPVILSLWEQFCNQELLMHRNILVLLKLNQQVDAMLEEHKAELAFPPEVARQFEKTIFAMGHLQLLVENHFLLEEGVPHLFTSTSKLHGLAHSALLSKYISPRMVWCFTGEDYMHHVQTLAQSCLAGTGPFLTANKVADKMRIALHVQFNKNLSFEAKHGRLSVTLAGGRGLAATLGAHFGRQHSLLFYMSAMLPIPGGEHLREHFERNILKAF